MADLITAVVVGSFGMLMLVVVLAFLLLRQRSGATRFEREDYYKVYRNRGGFSERRGKPPFKEDPISAQSRREARVLVAVLLGVTIASVAIAIIFRDLLEILLVLIFLPIIVRFVRARTDPRRRTRQDESHSY
jgi:Flp pilus assembly protein TadB